MKRTTLVCTSFGLFMASCILSFAGPPPVPDSFLLPEIDGPVLSGTDAIEKMRVIKPYKLELVAEEPAVMNPVDMRDAWTKPEAGHVDEHGFSNRATSARGHFFNHDNYFPDTFDGIIASPDTRFRPVEIRSGPDATIYIADMYHGIIQHKVFMNAHLTKLINEQKLDAPDYLGRIYRLSIDGKKGNAWKPIRNAGLDEPVKSLASKNP